MHAVNPLHWHLFRYSGQELIEYKEGKVLETNKIRVDNSLFPVKRKKLYTIYMDDVFVSSNLLPCWLCRGISDSNVWLQVPWGEGVSPKNCIRLCLKLSVQWKYDDNCYTLKLIAKYFGRKALILVSDVIWRYFILSLNNFASCILLL